MKYRARIADQILKAKLKAKGAVLIEGAKWCGKTTTAYQIAKSALFMQDPAQKEQNIMMADVNPSVLLQGETPRLIDEWQLAPKLWDAVRFEVDKRGEFNQFILTGSAVPPDLSQISHSGIGRISRLTMRPMSLFESRDSTGEVSLSGLFNEGYEVAGVSDSDIYRLAFLISRGGWPVSIGCDEETSLMQASDYYDGLINSDIMRANSEVHDKNRMGSLLRSYSRNIGSQVKYEEIRKDILSNDTDSFSIGTLYNYIRTLKDIFVIEDSPAWNPNLRSKTAIRTTDTRYFTDPSIAVASLGLGPSDLVNDLETMGLLFENMCIRDLRIYSDFIGGDVYHYRDRNGLECDAVIHLRNGFYGLVEIKLGGDKLINAGVNTLNALESALDISKMKSPSFKMIVVGVGHYAYRRPDGILVVPITCLRN